ncbi:GGDEF domain-containing protein [uncultured Cellulomonas sp.]|uniref:GGDEF domain-containing protein n=1 Tax=uncultured Cellulomonas sp. TaxID=189682 RepID=UPI0026075C5C|nr:GGDEF domain-containing protein [uncultured Cellulomonas sp.]
MRSDWSPPPLHGARARRLDARISGAMTVLGSLTAVPFAYESPYPGLLYSFAALCVLIGLLMLAGAARVRPWALSAASVLGAVGITSVAVHAPDGFTHASGPILYVIPVLQVGLLRSGREAWLQLTCALTAYAVGLHVVGFDLPGIGLTTLPVLLALAVLNAAVLLLRDRVDRLVGEVDRLIRELRHQVRHDALTGLLNRQGLIQHAASPDVLLVGSLLLIDVDHFKRINDVSGHLAGDEVLTQLGALLAAVLGPRETAVRVGGEEFLLILATTDAAAAGARAQDLRRHISATLRTPDGDPVTVSVGVASGDLTNQFTELYRQADDALYRAKARGRDRVELAVPGPAGSTGPGADAVVPTARDRRTTVSGAG